MLSVHGPNPSCGRKGLATFTLKTIGLLSLLCALSVLDADQRKPNLATQTAMHTTKDKRTITHYPHLQVKDRLGDLMNHPAFLSFSKRLLPWDGRHYDKSMPLKDIGQLMPYHSHVEPDVVVDALNRMVDDVNAGYTVFYDIYTAAQRHASPALNNSGLFFFRGKPGAPFAVIAPGGGFAYVGSVHEGFPYAKEISQQGLNAFVVKYRAGQGGIIATHDLAAALSYIFQNAESLQVSTAGYSLWGSSAGARMAAWIGSPFGHAQLPKPAAVVMAYTGHAEVAATEPPTFVVVGDRDGIAPPAVMESRITALRHLGTSVEYHKYPGVGHGFGAGHDTSAHGWIANAVKFWENKIKKTT